MADYKVVDIEQLEAGLTATAEAIREHTGKEDLMKLEEMPAEIEGVFEAGKKSEYDAFWDVVQEHGKRTDYNNVFAGYVFGTKNFYPKYNMKPTSANKMFYAWEGRSVSSEDWETFSLLERLKECGAILDTSLATDIGSMFAYSRMKKIPTIDARLATTSTSVFKNQREFAETIEKIIVNENIHFDDWFTNSYYINISFEGVIGQNLDILSNRFSKESIENVIVCLSNTTIGKTLSLSQTAVNKAFETATGAADGSTSEEWLALAATKSNWTISLV